MYVHAEKVIKFIFNFILMSSLNGRTLSLSFVLLNLVRRKDGTGSYDLFQAYIDCVKVSMHGLPFLCIFVGLQC